MMKIKSTSLLKILAVLLLVIIVQANTESDWLKFCNRCKCQWKSSHRAADCSDTGQVSIPRDLHTDLQLLDLSNNKIPEIVRQELQEVRLENLHKLFLRNCTMLEINRDAFMGLGILIELDLSHNQLKVIYPGTFSPLIKIRKILLNENFIEKLDDRTFENLLFLSKVELKNNKLQKIGIQTFLNVPRMAHISLESNRLQLLNVDSFKSLKSLQSLSLQENPWNCTCELKPFRDYAIDNKLYTPPTSCLEPSSLREKLWTEVADDDFACRPKILVSRSAIYIKASSGNQTLQCRVRGSPKPDIVWMFNKRSISSYDQRYSVRTYPEQNKGDIMGILTSELTITGLKHQDKGTYTCKASNKGGREEVDMTLDIPADVLHKGAFVPQSGNYFFMIICIVVGVLFIILFTIVILCCYCKRVNKYQKNATVIDNARLMANSNGPATKINGKPSSNDSILDGGSVIMEMQKSLLTEVNPVEKPPRRNEMDCIDKDSHLHDDLNDVKQTLLDETAFTHCDDETRSIQLSDTTTRSRQAFVDDGFGNHHLPPDLIAFSNRFPQSPSIQSSISNIHDARIYGRSPLTSPVYGETTIPSGYRTLQHPKTGRTIAIANQQRSNSPFIPAPLVYPQSIMKQGYVTIPRKPRTGSWTPTMMSSVSDYPTPSPSSPVPSELAIEPVYDNLGLRTTAAGNSILNLNKIGGSKSSSLSSPGANLKYSMKDRPLPATPLNGKIINGSGEQLHQLQQLQQQQQQQQQLHQNGSRDQLYSGSSTTERKVPPRPPPKPKKKLNGSVMESSFNETTSHQQPHPQQRIANGSHFEDEGEDGTEV